MPHYDTNERAIPPWAPLSRDLMTLVPPTVSVVWAMMRTQEPDWVFWAKDIGKKCGIGVSTVRVAFNRLHFHGYVGGVDIYRGGRNRICRFFFVSSVPHTTEEYFDRAREYIGDNFITLIRKMGTKINDSLNDRIRDYPDAQFCLKPARPPKKERKTDREKAREAGVAIKDLPPEDTYNVDEVPDEDLETVVISPIPEMPTDTTVPAVSTASVATPDKIDVCADYAKDITLSPGAKKSYVHMKKQARIDVVDVFNVWNSFKAPKDVVKPNGQVKWRRHTKMTHDMLTVLSETLKTHMIDEMCVAIENYATTLFSKETYWSHTYDLSSFFNVRHKKDFKGGEKKWLSFSEERWDLMSFTSRQENNTRQERENRRLEAAREEKALPYRAERDREVTKALIVAYKTSIKSRDYVPSKAGLTHFIWAANNLIEFFEKEGAKTSTPIMIGTLMGVIQKEYLDRGQEFKLWMLTNRHMWTALMPAKRAAK